MRTQPWQLGAAGAALLLTACGGGAVAQPPTETTAVLCQDGEDNDLDGDVDCDDVDCQGFVFCVQAQPSEVTAAACEDGTDNDADGDTDCADADCRGFVFCQSTESSSSACHNDADDDGDGLTDCDDPDCGGLVFCQPPTEDTATLCQDGTDNDGDGQVDCADSDCELLVACIPDDETTAAACRDGRDNDGDGLIDCNDNDCAGFTFCQGATENTAEACRDGSDNDRDGSSDCLDPDCQGFTFCYSPDETTAVACQDGQDNDSDGQTDCDDTDCAGFIFCRTDLEVSSTSCQDGQDNDSDGQTDCSDADCQGYIFCLSEESTTAACQDGADNDSDGRIDCDDDDCLGFVFCAFEESSAADCQDSADNDSDGLTDCDDPDCSGFVFCVSVESTSAACQDGADNDADGAIDCDDEDCAGFVFCASDEASPTACQDGQDNDSDGDVDCADSQCAGYTFCAAPTETTLAECQDGADNDGDGLTDCEDTDCQGYLQCEQASSTESTLAECQDGLDNDEDGLTDCDDEACWVWGACRHYQGYPLYDSWGEVWDGMERQAKTQAEAEATCRALGGRLPTATELWRNNWTSGTADLADATNTSYLWTLIERQSADQFARVRLSDGAVTYTAGTSTAPFRCVWPDDEGQGFDANRCYGPPGAPCFTYDRFWSADKYDRAPLDYAAAANECQFYGASLPVTAEWGELIHGGLPNGTNAWLWTAKATYWYSGNYGVSIVRWTDANASWWYYDAGNMGSLSTTGGIRQFRCVGLERPADFAVPSPAACTGDCATFTGRRSVVVADGQDRVAVRMAAAVTDCRDEGALLPNLADATDLVHGGWANGSNQWNWVTDSLYWYNGNYGHAVVRWSDTGPGYWGYYSGAFGGLAAASNNRAYRCLWHQQKPAWPSCQAGEIIQWNGTAFVCAAGGPGDSSANANPNGQQLVDEWGNAWDLLQRNQPATWADAKQACEGLGGRLPTATELWAVRATNNPHSSIGDVTSASYLWTSSPAHSGHRALVRISDGDATRQAETSAQYYRCIWPAAQSDVLYGGNCYGPPGSECFVTPDGIVADTYDRVAVDMAAAIDECSASGGHLPDHRDTIRLIHSGWPNGTNNWLWMAESTYWYNGGHGYSLARWTGAGTPSWEYTGNGALSYGYNEYRFRCVYTPELR